MTVKQSNRNGVEVFTLENNHLAVEIAPWIGGRITSIYNKLLSKEFLWSWLCSTMKLMPKTCIRT